MFILQSNAHIIHIPVLVCALSYLNCRVDSVYVVCGFFFISIHHHHHHHHQFLWSSVVVNGEWNIRVFTLALVVLSFDSFFTLFFPLHTHTDTHSLPLCVFCSRSIARRMPFEYSFLFGLLLFVKWCNFCDYEAKSFSLFLEKKWKEQYNKQLKPRIHSKRNYLRAVI